MTPAFCNAASSLSPIFNQSRNTSAFVLSDTAAEMINLSRCFGQAWDNAWDREIANALVRDAGQGVAYPKLFFRENLSDAVHRSAGDIAITTTLDDFITFKPRCPVGHDLVDAVARHESLRLRAILIVARKLRLGHDARQALKHFVIGAGDCDPLSVLGGVVTVGVELGVSVPMRSRTSPV